MGSGRPATAAGHAGTYCVIKISRRGEALEEHRRYERYMRFGASSDRRVELLGSAMGDTIGGLCYAFAGRSPERVTDLETLIDDMDPRSFGALDSLFGPSSEWSENQVLESNAELGGFFAAAYELEADSIIRELGRFAGDNAGLWGAAVRGEALRFGEKGSEVIPLPTENDLALNALRDDYMSSIVHGDMNSANVMVADDGRVMLIDFRHTCRGPRCIDLAALQTSLRLSSRLIGSDPAEVLRTYRIERKLLSDMAKGTERAGVWLNSEQPFWAQVAWKLTELPRRSRQDISVVEYAATCFLYALRILRITQLGELRRLRLLVWVSALLEVLRRPVDGAFLDPPPR